MKTLNKCKDCYFFGTCMAEAVRLDDSDCEDYTEYDELEDEDDAVGIWKEASFRKYVQDGLDTEEGEYELFEW